MLAAGVLLAGVPAQAVVILEPAGDRVEVNWSTLRVRFYGDGMVSQDVPGEEFKAAEKRAWVDGLEFVGTAIQNLSKAPEVVGRKLTPPAEDVRTMARSVAESTTSYKTVYFGDGAVRVYLENKLPSMLALADVEFKGRPSATAPTHSGMLFKLDRAVKPRAIYELVDETGAVLFTINDMNEAAFRTTLMGRWFKRPTAAELDESVGQNPVLLKAVAKEQGGKFVVKRADWDKALAGNQGLLADGRIALALP